MMQEDITRNSSILDDEVEVEGYSLNGGEGDDGPADRVAEAGTGHLIVRGPGFAACKMRKFMFGAAASLAAVAGFVSPAAGEAKETPPITQLCVYQLKWITGFGEVFGPSGPVAASARAAGYETVALDDFSYPPPRLGC